MTHISEVIGWKFNHQPGMSTRDGVITAFPGGIPSQADIDTWTAEYEAYLPTKVWQESMTLSDQSLPRWGEDIYDAMNPADQDLVDQHTKDLIAQKKALRATKPQG